MHLSDVLLIVVPVVLFLLGAAGSGIVAVVKLTTAMAKSQKAQESTAESNGKILKTLEHYMAKTDATVNDHGERISVLEFATGVRQRSSSRRDEDY